MSEYVATNPMEALGFCFADLAAILQGVDFSFSYWNERGAESACVECRRDRTKLCILWIDHPETHKHELEVNSLSDSLTTLESFALIGFAQVHDLQYSEADLEEE